ncbi:GNAT family N-acetyltransferase [Flaviflexus huanghaiensis]|uniref:GNAT family N-acetyltransferase n=1 Tax=Flaviflexus huanghaiensis TaxID=1111473 RepID=UPI0015F8713B|nr:GNAT family N-acetyltransferase [Flaviflexus huanghaiensis]
MTEMKYNEQSSRYEAHVDGETVGFIDYRREGDTIVAIHTQIGEQHQGEGLGGKLVANFLDDARASGLNVLPQCGYVASVISKNEQYIDLVPAERRRDFGL